jgi:hypothetical protein
MNDRRLRLNRRPKLESLEGRRLQAGNVTASIVNGDLRITGDNLANEVSVFRQNGFIRVHGFNNTRINGSAVDAIFSQGSLSHDLRADMKGGSDTLLVDLSGLHVPHDIFVDTGDGNDFVRLTNLSAGNDITIDTQRGDDRVFLVNVTAGDDLKIDTGQDRDSVFLLRVQAHDRMDIDLGSGDADRLDLAFVTAHNAHLNGGFGSTDTLRRRNASFDHVDIDGFEVFI